MFGTDPDEVQRRVSQWAQQFADKTERFEAMRERFPEQREDRSGGPPRAAAPQPPGGDGGGQSYLR